MLLGFASIGVLAIAAKLENSVNLVYHTAVKLIGCVEFLHFFVSDDISVGLAKLYVKFVNFGFVLFFLLTFFGKLHFDQIEFTDCTYHSSRETIACLPL